MRLIRLSQATRYALCAMTYLARQSGKGFLLVEEIAGQQNLPKNFLGKVFQKLAQGGLLVSRRGPGGGYALARPAGTICLREICDVVMGPAGQSCSCLLELHECGEANHCLVHGVVAKAEEIMSLAFEKTTLADLVHKKISN